MSPEKRTLIVISEMLENPDARNLNPEKFLVKVTDLKNMVHQVLAENKKLKGEKNLLQDKQKCPHCNCSLEIKVS